MCGEKRDAHESCKAKHSASVPVARRRQYHVDSAVVCVRVRYFFLFMYTWSVSGDVPRVVVVVVVVFVFVLVDGEREIVGESAARDLCVCAGNTPLVCMERHESRCIPRCNGATASVSQRRSCGSIMRRVSTGDLSLSM